ncbi:MAG TPA: amidohydrolase family protein [Burkholderiaceae bacterium]|nr:amidohydrolase family protein [Burkholderiaceae bacterium]
MTRTGPPAPPSTPSGPPRRLDLLLLGVDVLTVDPSRPELRDAALGVLDGRIAWLDAAPPPGLEATEVLRLPGRVVVPGFVNVHNHAILSMVRGVAVDLGFAPSYTPGIPKGTDVTPGQARAIARLGALEMLLFGSTLIGDNFVHADVTTEAMAELGVRLAPSWRVHDVDFAKVAHGEWRFDPAIGRRTLDGALALHERWRGHPRVTPNIGAHAVDTCSEDFLREIAAVSAAHDLRVNTHLGQSTVEVERVRARTGRTSTQVLDDVGLLGPRLMGGHCIYVDDDDVARMARAGAHAIHIPKCNAASGRLAPTPKLAAAGINIALATDTQHGDMVELMRWALATARVQRGGVDDDWQPARVLEMATLGGARALGLDADIGSLAIGRKADFAVFDFRRPHLVPRVSLAGTLVHNAQGRDVELVAVDGELLVRDGRPTKVDAERICAEAEHAIRALWAGAGKSYWENPT